MRHVSICSRTDVLHADALPHGHGRRALDVPAQGANDFDLLTTATPVALFSLQGINSHHVLVMA